MNEKEKILVRERNELEKYKEDFKDNKLKIEKKIAERDPEKYLKELEKKEAELKKNLKAKDKEMKRSEAEYNKKQNRESALKEGLERLNKEILEVKELLSQKIIEFKFKSIEKAQELLQWEENIKEWEQEIKEFDNEKRDIDNNINKLMKELSGESITKEKWNIIKEEKTSLEEKLKELQGIIGGQKSKIERLKDDLEDKRENEKQKKELDHKLDLIKEIDDLVRGKSFVEFVAVRQLRYIALEASKRLMEITNNRYRLELNEQGEFVISDLYNGGVKRDCNTLSGGETFLSSLALALALSSRIQLKGRSSMEFFFLDEGFGTLDSNLLDVVMDSLENLQNENLKVGIISHVEELKHRVPVKLMVEPAEAGIRGTKVSIKYS